MRAELSCCSLVLLFVGTWPASAQTTSCTAGISYDDSSFETGYRIPFAADARYVQKFTPASYPGTLANACACWVTSSATSMGFNFVFYDDDGPAGQPGTFLGSVGSSVQAPASFAPGFVGVDCAAVNIVLGSGSVYVGTQWNAGSNFRFFICSDTSLTTPLAEAYNSSNGGLSWSPVAFQDGRFRALGIRAILGEPIGVPGSCRPGANVLCLNGGRFRAELDWHNQFDGRRGQGIAVPRTDLTGFFAFDNRENIEIILKVLDFGDAILVFYGQLTNLQFTLRITDARTGRVKVYRNTPGDCGGFDTNAFTNATSRVQLNQRIRNNAFPAGSCKGDAHTLCLLNNRFRVQATWSNQFNGQSGTAGAVALTNLSGILHYGDPSNVEVLVKTLDFGNGQILFLYGALSNLGYTITLTDTLSGQSKTYLNEPGKYCGGIDTDAF